MYEASPGVLENLCTLEIFSTLLSPRHLVSQLTVLTTLAKRLRCSRGSVLAFVSQVRGFKPERSRWIFQGEKILSTPSFGGEVKPSVPCRRFTVCKRSLNVTWKSGIFQAKFSGHF